MPQTIDNMIATWNASGTTFSAIKMNVTDTASASGSLLMDLQLGGVSQFRVAKTVTNVTDTSGSHVFASMFQTQRALLWGSATGGGLKLNPSTVISWQSGSDISRDGAVDVTIRRRAAANLQLGAADTASPVAQTLGVQSVTGVADTAGANFAIAGSQGTGTGAGGSIVFQVAPAGVISGTAQNALSSALTITPVGGSSPLFIVPSYSKFVTNNLVFTENTGYLRASINGGAAPDFRIAAGGAFAFSSDGNATNSPDVIIRRDAANTLALRNGANAQVFNTYNAFTDASNYERTGFSWSGNVFYIGTTQAGTGSARDLWIGTGGSATLKFYTNSVEKWIINPSGHFLAVVDNTYDIGASGATRPRNVYVANDVTAGGNVTVAAGALFRFTARGSMWATADGVFQFSDNAASSFGRINFGGGTSSFPALKRSSTTLQARLADDSDYAPVQGKLTTETAYTAGDPTTTGYLVLYDSNGTAYKVPAVAV